MDYTSPTILLSDWQYQGLTISVVTLYSKCQKKSVTKKLSDAQGGKGCGGLTLQQAPISRTGAAGQFVLLLWGCRGSGCSGRSAWDPQSVPGATPMGGGRGLGTWGQAAATSLSLQAETLKQNLL